MTDKKNILRSIKKSVKSSEPNATIILYGSYARGDHRKSSDVDLLILLDKERVTREDEKKIKYPLYDIEFDTGRIISPFILTKSDWESKHKMTPFYKNVHKEGVVL